MGVDSLSRVLVQQFGLFPSYKATDTSEERNNPTLMYNKMHLGAMKFNFTLEFKSGVSCIVIDIFVFCT